MLIYWDACATMSSEKDGINMDRTAEIIAALMKEKNLSLRSLAEKSDVSKSSLQRYLKVDMKKMSISDFEKICKVLGADPAEVLGWVNSSYKREKELDQIATTILSLDEYRQDQVRNFVDFLLSKQDKQ